MVFLRLPDSPVVDRIPGPVIAYAEICWPADLKAETGK